MNKNNIKIIAITALITTLLVGGTCVVAATLTAKDIGFTSNNEGWQVNNVEDAVNDLYELGKNGKPAVVFTTSPVDMKDYTDRWQELTGDDFICGASSVSSSVSNNSSAGCYSGLSETPKPTYDNTIGTLTFTATFSKNETVGAGGMLKAALSGKTFCVWLGTVGGK